MEAFLACLADTGLFRPLFAQASAAIRSPAQAAQQRALERKMNASRLITSTE
jgi:hypothetical protein